MKRIVLAWIFTIFLAMLVIPAFAQSFSNSDLEGSWTGYNISVNPTIPAVFWLQGTATIDASGNVLSGAYVAPDGSTITVTSGNLALDPKGVLSGSATLDTSDTVTFVHGKQDQSKTNATFVTSATDGRIDIGHFIKNGGNFSDSDLTGTWHGYLTIIDPSTGAVFWVYGTMDVDVSGSVTGSFSAPDGTTMTVDAGTLFLDSDGILSGSLDISSELTAFTAPITHGKIDQGKTRGVFVSTASDGRMSLGHLVKTGGTFRPSDAVGNWYAYGLGIDPSIPVVYWAYGDLTYDTSGHNFTVSYALPTGDIIDGAGTSVLDDEGIVTSSTTLSTGDTFISPSIKSDQGKTASVGVMASPTTGAMGIWQFFKESYLVGPYVQQVQTMYIAYYGRPGDPGGVEYWAERLEAVGGNWIADLVNAFGTSPEYTERFGSLSSETLIDNLFLQLFNRVADVVGRGFYIDLLNRTNVTGLNPTLRQSTLAQIALDIANGAQEDDLTTLQNKLAVADYFTNRIVETGQRYDPEDIPEAVSVLELVSFESDSVTDGLNAVDDFVQSALVDSDGDGVSDRFDQCPGEDDNIDVDQDGVPDCYDLLVSLE